MHTFEEMSVYDKQEDLICTQIFNKSDFIL